MAAWKHGTGHWMPCRQKGESQENNHDHATTDNRMVVVEERVDLKIIKNKPIVVRY